LSTPQVTGVHVQNIEVIAHAPAQHSEEVFNLCLKADDGSGSSVMD
jgi:hypothetical protein